ncbi:MAG: hypothetical protein IT462_15535 [Planctomycetes bacterium]|nr:hypothetical protein [Planctomycetota bacterium]
MRYLRSGVLAAATALVLCGVVASVSAKSVVPANEPAKPPKAEEPEAAIKIKVYEWGVETVNWDGSAESPAEKDVPAFYYDASEVPVGVKPEPLEPEKPPVRPEAPVRKKPVVYFDCEQDYHFDLEIKFSDGKLTWMYPMPTRLVDESTVQWDEIRLISDHMEHMKAPAIPALADVKVDHWAHFSRFPSTSSLVVNGEHERFIFYEGTNTAAPEVDIFKDAEGRYILRNYCAWPIFDVRAAFAAKDGIENLWAERVEAASGETPTEIQLRPIPPKPADPQQLLKEVQRAGLLEAQGKAFTRCWDKAITGANSGTLSYRRDPAMLDAAMTLTVTGAKLESARVGYMLISKIDLSKQAEIDALAATAAGGDAEAVKKLSALGMAGFGAVRRAIANKDLGLKQRLALAKVMKELDAARRK